ncbi:SCL-interrupting locus [Amphibalanus amphitrite]|uniref:SCL-interrupting locus n=1 Tax=Amphibalanus amphitrite TaxID=1232801 RepID=A0A6A4VHX0_AMPAM|nr:SCL-interrupting locus [Amphibalanus amphitrite]
MLVGSRAATFPVLPGRTPQRWSSPLTRPAAVAPADVSICYDDGREVPRPTVAAHMTPPAESAAVSPRSAGSPVSSSGGSAGVQVPAEPSCCGAELRAVLRLVADNGRQLAQLRAQFRQLLSRETPPTPPARCVLMREAHTQTEDDTPRRPTTAAAAVNTSFSLTPRRDVGTDPAAPCPPARADRTAAVPPPAERTAAVPPPAAEVTGSGGRENTAQLQRRRVQEWVAGEGWAEEAEPELTLRGLVLPPVPEQQPSPEASVHVDMPVYQQSPGGSCDGSVADDAEADRPRRPDTTFFQNVMGQVNQILDGAAARGESGGSAEVSDKSQSLSASPVPRHRDEEVIEAETDPVRRATLQQLRAAGVSLVTSQANDESMLDYSCPPRAVRTTAAVPCSTDLSLEMNTLAMKYVDSRQLMQRAAAVGGRPAPHPVEARLLGKENLAPPSRGRPTDMTMYGISDSNMSFSTRKYMEKFNLQS